jgi:putative colanic acid biosynthesis UDP-glucose lipid carrier transferase
LNEHGVIHPENELVDDATADPAPPTSTVRRADAGVRRGHRARVARVRPAGDTNRVDEPMSAVSTVHRGVIASRRWPRALHPGHGVEIALRVVDIVVLVLGAHLAHALITGGALPGEQGVCVMATALFALVLFPAAGLYRGGRLTRLAEQMPRLGGAWLAVLAGALSAVFVVDPAALPPRDWVVVWLVVTFFLLAGTRIGAAAWIDRAHRLGQLAWHVAVVGSGGWGREAARRLEQDRRDIRVVGYIELPTGLGAADVELNLRQLLTTQSVDHVAIALDPSDLDHVTELLDVLRDFPFEVGVLPAVSPATTPTLGHRRLGDLTSFTCLQKPIDGWAWLLKSAFDRVAAATALLFLLPLLTLIGAAIKVTSPGPVFFTQKRLGFNQQPVDVFKFRSMYADRCDLQNAQEVRHATRNDPRVTPVGRFIRRTSLDELPQLLNVLRGEMSLVGPRPHAVAHDEYYATLIDGYLGRHRAKPGITGWAQVNGCRGEIHTLEDMRRRIELDLFYIDNWSLWFDLRILLRTAVICFKDEQAY